MQTSIYLEALRVQIQDGHAEVNDHLHDWPADRREKVLANLKEQQLFLLHEVERAGATYVDINEVEWYRENPRVTPIEYSYESMADRMASFRDNERRLRTAFDEEVNSSVNPTTAERLRAAKQEYSTAEAQVAATTGAARDAAEVRLMDADAALNEVTIEMLHERAESHGQPMDQDRAVEMAKAMNEQRRAIREAQRAQAREQSQESGVER